MLQSCASIGSLVALAALLAPGAGAPQSAPARPDLDWQAPLRWVHIDNVEGAKAQVFEESRKDWLAALRTESGSLDDGRPLFWHARAGAVQTYFTLYPLRRWADLDARRETVKQTQATVGEEPVRKHDTGDAALVSHYSQVWRREAEYDITWPDTEGLTELSAGVGRLEVRELDIRHDAEFDRLWKDVTQALLARKYPLVCRVYSSVLGKGECMLLWLAPDAAAYRAAPTLAAALAQELGEEKSADIVAALEKICPLQKSYEIERRPDLSNLAR